MDELWFRLGWRKLVGFLAAVENDQDYLSTHFSKFCEITRERDRGLVASESKPKFDINYGLHSVLKMK